MKPQNLGPPVINLNKRPTKGKLVVRPRHYKLLASIIVLAIFARWLAEQTPKVCLIGLTGLFALTLLIALAAFFKAYEKES